MIGRKEVREALAALLRGSLATAQEVYDYQIGDFGGKSPIVYLTSSGSLRTPLTFRGTKSTFWINAHVCVLYADAESGWTEAMAEDALDDLEKEIAGVISNSEASRGSQLWSSLEYADRTDADTNVIVGGKMYLHETITIRVEMAQ